jgi:hypothetical protein
MSGLLGDIGQLAQLALPRIAAARGAQLQGQQQGQTLLQQIQALAEEKRMKRAMHDATLGRVTAETRSANALADERNEPKIRRRAATQFMLNGKPVQGFADDEGSYWDASGKKVEGDITPYERPVREASEPLVPVVRNGKRVYEPRSSAAGQEAPSPEGPGEDRTVVPVQQEDGTVTYQSRAAAIGQQAPSRAAVGSASLKNKRSTNHKQMAVIDDALKELDAYPDAVGLKRGLGELVPGMGNIGDAWNQRKDSKGVAARAQIANIGSLVIHERSGAAVTISEFPRLAPFVPRINDTPATIRTKLAKLRLMIREETDALNDELGSGGTSGNSATSNIPSYEEWKAGQKTTTPTKSALPKRARVAPGTKAMATVAAPPKRDDHR